MGRRILAILGTGHPINRQAGCVISSFSVEPYVSRAASVDLCNLSRNMEYSVPYLWGPLRRFSGAYT